MRPDRVKKMPRALSSTELIAELDKIARQPELGRRESIERKKSFSLSRNDPEPEEYGADQPVEHRGTGKRAEYRVLWYGYRTREDTYKPATELPANFIRGFWASRRRRRE